MAENRRAGIIRVTSDGALIEAKGEFSYNLGKPKRDVIIGSDGVHGYKETPQAAFIEGATTDRSDLDLAALVTQDNVTVVLTLVNGKSIVLTDAWYAGDGTAKTGEAEITVRWESRKEAEEV